MADHTKSLVHHTDDGQRLEVKEGVVLDRDGTPLASTEQPSSTRSEYRRQTIKVWHMNWLVGLVLSVLIPLLLVTGFGVVMVIIGVILALALTRMIFRTILQLFRIN
jgi:hypothetical protein